MAENWVGLDGPDAAKQQEQAEADKKVWEDRVRQVSFGTVEPSAGPQPKGPPGTPQSGEVMKQSQVAGINQTYNMTPGPEGFAIHTREFTLDPDSYKNQFLNSQKMTLNNRIQGLQQQQAPTAQAASVGPMAQASWNKAGYQTANAAQGTFQGAGQQSDAQVQAALGGANSVSGQQGSFAQYLAQVARGEGPSIAGQQMQQGMNRSISNAMALAAAQNGQNPSLALRNIQDQTAQAQQQTINQARNC
jgi:hypothetical protein